VDDEEEEEDDDDRVSYDTEDDTMESSSTIMQYGDQSVGSNSPSPRRRVVATSPAMSSPSDAADMTSFVLSPMTPDIDSVPYFAHRLHEKTHIALSSYPRVLRAQRNAARFLANSLRFSQKLAVREISDSVHISGDGKENAYLPTISLDAHTITELHTYIYAHHHWHCGLID
jgi:hypothetical protein